MTNGSWDSSKREIRLWALDRSGRRPKAVPVTSMACAEAESLLEDILVGHPELLEQGLTIIGRQLATESGPLDLVGVDGDGRLVIFELKRGTLVRDAVTQTLDYAAAIQEMDRDSLARHLAACSGRNGVGAIPDFDAWYNDAFPDNDDEFAQRPRMVLVGLGIDHRARRMVKFLADSGVEIDVLTFHIFDRDGQQFIARHVEVAASDSTPKSSARGVHGREIREARLQGIAAEADVVDLLDDMRTVVHEHLRSNGRGFQNKYGVTFYRRDWRDDSPGKGRAYVSLVFDPKAAGRVTIALVDRAVREGGDAVLEFLRTVPVRKSMNGHTGLEQHEFEVTRDSWPKVRDRLGAALDAVADGVDLAEQEALEGGEG